MTVITREAGPVRLETILRIKRASSPLSFTGWATTPDLDRMGDRVEPRGASFEAPLPLLWQHDHAQPLGVVDAATVSDRGIRVTFRLLPEVARSSEAAALIEAGALALSIGFIGEEWSPLSDGGRRWTRWTWTELSLVSVPANASAQIDRIGKGFVQPAPAAPVATAPPAAQRSVTRAAPLAVDFDDLTNFARGIGGLFKELLDPLRAKLVAAEKALVQVTDTVARLEESSLHDGGFHVEGKTYQRGAVVTGDGKTWLSTRTTNETPGRGSGDWRLLGRKNP